jgi:hypothetical protein
MASPAPRVRLKGNAHLDVHAAREAGKLVLSGYVVDDAGHPVRGARVNLGFAPASNPRAWIAFSRESSESCGSSAAPEIDRADLLVLTTDDAARLCVRLTLPADHYIAHVEVQATDLVDGAKLDLPLDLALPPITLRFDPERPYLSLDDDVTSLEVLASTEDEGVTTAAAGLALSLSNEGGGQLGSAITDPSGHARFMIDSARLGPPGRGELRVASADGARATTHAMRIERRTRVDLVIHEAIGQRLPLGWSEDGIALRLVATPRCANRGCPGMPSGTVEARVTESSAIVGAAPLEGNEARLVITFAAPFDGANASEVPMTFRYVPSAPWFQPAADLQLIQPVRGPSPWKKAPLVIAATLVVAWLALMRVPIRSADRRKTTRPRIEHAVEHVQIVRAGPRSLGWQGRVADAHDGVALAGVRVAIERPGFEHIDVVAQSTSDATGAFTLAPIGTRPGDVLVVDGRLHQTLRHPLPASGELSIALVLRRRALLDRLVTWARQRGSPYDAQPEPTPGHVRRASSADSAVARWADAVERAAYGGDLVDERAQAEVDRLAPTDSG